MKQSLRQAICKFIQTFDGRWRCDGCGLIMEFPLASRLCQRPSVQVIVQESQLTQETQKLCPCCRKKFPYTEQYFHRNSAQANGLNHACKTCHNDRKRKRQWSKHEKQEVVKALEFAKTQGIGDTEILNRYLKMLNQQIKESLKVT